MFVATCRRTIRYNGIDVVDGRTEFSGELHDSKEKVEVPPNMGLQDEVAVPINDDGISGLDFLDELPKLVMLSLIPKDTMCGGNGIIVDIILSRPKNFFHLPPSACPGLSAA
jgi:hypothetical protein